MISAKEAREKSEQNKQNILNKEMAIIEEEINKAIVKGQDYTYIGSAISSKVKQILEQLGYKVKYGQQYNESYTSIEWR